MMSWPNMKQTHSTAMRSACGIVAWLVCSVFITNIHSVCLLDFPFLLTLLSLIWNETCFVSICRAFCCFHLRKHVAIVIVHFNFAIGWNICLVNANFYFHLDRLQVHYISLRFICKSLHRQVYTETVNCFSVQLQ